MSILQSIIFFLSLGLLIVGVHQVFTVGFYESYWLFMLSLVMLFVYNFMKKKSKDRPASGTKSKSKRK